MADATSASSSSSDDSSDDEFLTTPSGTDREALVRKKLLENFYGKSAVAASLAPSHSNRGVGDSYDDDDDDEDGASSATKRRGGAETDDLDSKDFDPLKYAEKHIRESSVHELLETEEKLALQVRTLDSTMQTLVYENYSRFIDATDAIRSIGVNVQANQAGLQQLTSSMSNVNDAARSIEEAVGELRDKTAEKIRVKRLLTRLDALLKLPNTLQDQIAAGKYRTAARSYHAAASILAKHSQGFESLKNIETECNSILKTLKKDLQRKLLHWSGRLTSGMMEGTLSSDDEDDADGTNYALNDEENDNINAPDPPQNMTEVFECAGTLYMLQQQEDEQNNSSEDLFSVAVTASMRFLDRLLDAHLIQVQERRFAAETLMLESQQQEENAETDGSALVPREFLDAVLEGATLFGMSFGSQAQQADGNTKTASTDEATSTSSYYLLEFVSEAFESFLSHVRSILLEESIQAAVSAEDSGSSSNKEISGALSLLVQNVRELASGLALPEVGINVDYAAKLVDQTMTLTESMVRRRVDQKFHELRLSVVKDCLIPFATRAVSERDNAIKDGKEVLPLVVQIASSTLSDCLQLVDDTIRSIFLEGTDIGEAGDFPELKDAVHNSTYRFASWLANAFEVLAGEEYTDSKHVAEAPLVDEADASDQESVDGGLDNHTSSAIGDEDFGGGDVDEKELFDLMDSARECFVCSTSDESDGALHHDFVLAIFELCRLSEASVPENLEQSLTTHLGGGKKKSRGIFPTGETATEKDEDGDDHEIAKRFQLAASRVLVLYTMNCGMDAANILCQQLVDLAGKTEADAVSIPSSATLDVLSAAKRTAIECASIFGDPKRGGPVPQWDDGILAGPSLSVLNRKTGLQLDVERMFKEKVTIYPHPSEVMEASRNAVLFLFFKIVFRSMFENARLCTFSSNGYRQLLVDTTFLKHMVPHYVNNGYFTDSLFTLVGDVVEMIEDRCTDESCAQDDGLKQEIRDALRSFVASVQDDGNLVEQFIVEED